MKKLTALVLVCVLALGMVTATAEKGSSNYAEIYSYDFDLCFQLNVHAFPLRERKHMQGYTDLLDALEFKGNYSWCPATDSSDFQLEIIPKSNPDAKLSFRVYGVRSQRLISSSLFGDEKVSFAPAYFMHFAESVWEVIRLPLYLPALLNPQITVTAFRSIMDVWNWGMSKKSSTGVLSKGVVNKIAEGWRTQIAENDDFNTWMRVITNPLPEGDIIQDEIRQLPDLLLSFAGNKGLRIISKAGVRQCRNNTGEILWEEQATDQQYSFSLNLPLSQTGYKSSVAYLKEIIEQGLTVKLDLNWSRVNAEEPVSAEVQNYPGTIQKIRLELDHLPDNYPADASISGQLETEGVVLPELHCEVRGKTSSDGSLELYVTLMDKEDVGTIFSCIGSIAQGNRSEPLEFIPEELSSPLNLFELSFNSKSEIVETLDKPIALGLIDFLYELPVSACQSIMDDLEDLGILSHLMK